jgi:hypothetical protein
LVIEIVGLPLVERTSLEDQVWSCNEVGLHTLRTGATVDIGIEDSWYQTGSAPHAVIGKNWSLFRAGNTRLAIKVWNTIWTNFSV